MTGAQFLWRAAGSPEVDGLVTAGGACWWCAGPIQLGKPLATFPTTFMEAVGRDAAGGGRFVCPACAWTLSDQVVLPEATGGGLLERALAEDGDGRVSLAFRGPPEKVLVARVGSERIGVWARPGGRDAQRVEAAWRARPGDVPQLGQLDIAAARRMVGGKFRNFWVYATTTDIRFWTKAHREEVRAVVCAPPASEWVLTLGDGQKHVGIYAPVSDGRAGWQVIRTADNTVHYRPDTLVELLHAVEEMLLAGFTMEQVSSGRCVSASADQILVTRRWGALLEHHRRSSLWSLVETLRRPVSMLRGE